MTRTLILYINHADHINPEEMTDEYKDTIVAHMQNWLNTHGLQGWLVDGEFEDEG